MGSATVPVLTAPAPVHDVPRTFFRQSLLEYLWLKWNMIQHEGTWSRVSTAAVQRGLWAASQWFSPIGWFMGLVTRWY